MYTYTTPTYTFNFPESIDIALADSIYVTFSKSSYEPIFTKEDREIDIDSENNAIIVSLSQDETSEFPKKGKILIQINWIYDGVRYCSEIMTDEIKRNLLDEEI